MIRRIGVAIVAVGALVAVAAPTSAGSSQRDDEPAVSAPPNGAPCCDAVWCIGQETACGDTCDRTHKPGTAKWTACHKYCSDQISRCTACCKRHHVPDCNAYCFSD